MAILDNIEVRIWSDGKLLTEYEDPDEHAADDTKTAIKFIEATPGVKFFIEVTIMAGYRFHGADGVRVDRRMDGQLCISKILKNHGSGDSVTQSITAKFQRDIRFDDRSGQWIEAFFSFGRLEILEHSELPDDLNPQKAMQLGTIELTCQRARKIPLHVPWVPSKIPGLTSVDQTSEKVLKGKTIENNIRYTDEHVIPQPAARNTHYVATNGPYGGCLTFKFHYRSHRALQTLGCIPRSQSPAIVIQDDKEAEEKPILATSESDNAELESSQRAKEIERLQASTWQAINGTLSIANLSQAELAKLRRLDQAPRGVKVEAGDNENTSGERDTLPSLKRELEENNVRIKREESGPRKRSRTSGPIEMVDLTAD